jgi:ABC-2 type transport system permease protein
VAVATPFVVGSAFGASFLGFNRDPTAILAVTLSTLIALLMYASFFTWLGMMTKQAIAVGLVYIVLWEGFFSGYVSGIRYFSIRHYSAALAHGFDPRRFMDDQHVGFALALALAALTIVLFFWLSVRRLRRMDVP